MTYKVEGNLITSFKEVQKIVNYLNSLMKWQQSSHINFYVYKHLEFNTVIINATAGYLS